MFSILFGILTICFLVIAVTPVAAQCPVCIVTIGGGMFLAKKLGIDDLLVSIWISALNTAISFWLASKFKLKFFKNPWILSIIMLSLTLFYFQFTDQIGHTSNRLLGIDKIIFGQILGMLVMFLGNFIYAFTKHKNKGITLFPYAKVVFPFVSVLITTLVFKLLFKL
jgi:hypothetical protein